MTPEAKELLALNISDRALMRTLPPTLAEIARIVGIKAMIIIADFYGGKKIWFGKKSCDEGYMRDLVRIIGPEKARSLSQFFADGHSAHIEIPNSLLGRTLKILRALAMLENGASSAEVANKHRVCQKTVQLWKRKYMD